MEFAVPTLVGRMTPAFFGIPGDVDEDASAQLEARAGELRVPIGRSKTSLLESATDEGDVRQDE